MPCGFMHSSIKSCGPVPWPWKYAIKYPMFYEQSKNIWFIFHTFMLNLKIWVELYSQHYAQWITTHIRNICREYCPSQYYSLQLLFIATISLKMPTLLTIIILIKLTLFIIRVGVNHVLLSKLLPTEVRQWRSMSYAKYTKNTTLQLNNVMLLVTVFWVCRPISSGHTHIGTL